VESSDAPLVRLVVVPSSDGPRSVRDLLSWQPRAVDGELRIGLDTLALVADLAAARSEQESTEADRFGRVPSRVNALVVAGLERTPVLDIVAGRIGGAVQNAAAGRPFRWLPAWPTGASWAAALTHDLDVVAWRSWAAALTHDLDVVAWWPLFAALRWIELARGTHVRMLTRAFLAAARALAGDPVLEAVRAILAVESEFDVRSTWFVLAGVPTLSTFRRGDLTYRLESKRARAAIDQIVAAGHEVGLHGSFATFQDETAFRAERARAAAASGRTIDGARQHFLRMRPPATQRAMRSAGFSYDATFGFPDRNGFRLATASPISAWDVRGATAIDIELAPLIWMDRSMSKYAGVQDPARWIDDALALAQTAREANGMWVGLWHPNLADALGYPGAPEQYRRLVRELRAADAYIAPLNELVAWRKRRRAFRLTHVAADGSYRSNDPELARSLASQ
jgi:peptidoglycan/xylan/chitin deacetylase (PgdA/CDA1 family)